MFTLLALSVALAAPPSSTLVGPEGTLSWEIRSTDNAVTMRGTSPRWTVEHTAAPDLTPRRTTHQDPKNGLVIIEYSPEGAQVSRLGKRWSIEQPGLWDGDTVDVRLGSEVAAGRTDLAFSVVDPGSGKVYSLDSARVAEERCGEVPCTHVRVQITGLLRLVGPTWHYWYGGNGQLLRFDGPVGAFAVGGVP